VRLCELVQKQWLCCVVLIWASEFFEPKDYVVQRFDICNGIEWRSLELRQESFNRLWFKPFCDRFQTSKAARGGLKHL